MESSGMKYFVEIFCYECFIEKWCIWRCIWKIYIHFIDDFFL